LRPSPHLRDRLYLIRLVPERNNKKIKIGAKSKKVNPTVHLPDCKKTSR
jgi:hypothetical protein